MSYITCLLDSEASCHVINRMSYFTNYIPLELEVVLGDSSTVRALGKGSVEITVQCGSKEVKLKLEETLFVPKMTHCLISLSQLIDSRFW